MRQILTPAQIEAQIALKKIMHAFPNRAFILLSAEHGSSEVEVISNLSKEQEKQLLMDVGRSLTVKHNNLN
jgi:hypothetical protein